MRNVLIGNGINIQFGGEDYYNAQIIERVLANLNTKDYTNEFAGKITNAELKDILLGIHSKILPSIISGEYDQYCFTENEMNTMQRVKKQYSTVSDVSEIGMEDFFFILRLFQNSFNDSEESKRAVATGISILLLDAIYNDGEIQQIHNSIDKNRKEKLHDFFDAFNEIFTVNYDCTIEMIANKNVHYLHGDFNTLHEQYNSNTLLGKHFEETGEVNPVTTENKHLYCNAIMGFTGSLKEKVMQIFENTQLGIKQIQERLDSGLMPFELAKIEKLKISDRKEEIFAYGLIQISTKYPSLSIHRYPSNYFKEIEGELHIIGLSPNNDEHIWNIINENTKLDKIVYYYRSEQDKNHAKSIYPHLNILTENVNELWQELK